MDGKSIFFSEDFDFVTSLFWIDNWFYPSTEAFLEGEDYEGAEDECDCDDEHDHGPAGSSPLGFFGAGRNPIS